jgi:tetratricopeptide (TPR) repeat protein
MHWVEERPALPAKEPCATGRYAVGTGGQRCPSIRLAVFLLLVVLRLVLPKPLAAQQPIPRSWIGRRVVQRFNNLTLRIEDRVIDRKRVIHFYMVEQTNGPWLWVRAENNGFSGWAKVDEMVPVDEGIDFFTRRIRENPSDVFSYMMRGTLWQDKHDHQKALSDFGEAIRLSPNDAWVYNDRAILWFEAGDYERAIADCNQAIRLEPEIASSYNNRGEIWRKRKVYDVAIDDFSRAIELNPEYIYAYYNRGLARADKELYDGAIADFGEVIRLDPHDYLGYYNRGLAWAYKKENDSAIADFDKTIELSPQFGPAYFHRGLAKAAKKNYDLAIADYDHAIRLSPKNAMVYHERGLARVERKDYAKALADFDQAIRLDSNYDEAYLGRAWLLASCPDTKYRDPKKAVESATRACELTDWHEAHDLGGLAAVYAETGNVAEAVKWQSRAIELLAEDHLKTIEPIRLGHH